MTGIDHRLLASYCKTIAVRLRGMKAILATGFSPWIWFALWVSALCAWFLAEVECGRKRRNLTGKGSLIRIGDILSFQG